MADKEELVDYDDELFVSIGSGTHASDSHIGSTDANESSDSYHLPDELDVCADGNIDGEEVGDDTGVLPGSARLVDFTPGTFLGVTDVMTATSAAAATPTERAAAAAAAAAA